jgi:TIR domain
MPNSDSSAFISYHHDDRIVGETLYDQLTFLASRGDGRRFLSCFLDGRDLPRGKPWKPMIDENLGNKDWLIVIFTGEQSVYCGYEIGTFSQMHAQSPDKHIMGLYDVEDESLPVILRDTQNTRAQSIDYVSETKDVTVSADEVTLWYHSAVGTFLVDFCSYHKLYTQAHEKDDPGAYASSIALSAKRITNAFALARGNDVKNETPTQASFEITIKGIGNNRPERVPGNAAIVGTSLFFDLLDLALPVSWNQAPNTTWETLQELLRVDGVKDAPWMYKVEADILRAIGSRTPSQEDVTLRGKNEKVYRAILIRHQLFFNNDRKFYFVLAETLDRRFIGSEHSSLLLTALILASRWRFTYFEKWSDTNERIFGDNISLSAFADSCKQLIYNIEWIEHEAAELGTADTRALVEAFGQEQRARVERFFEEWDEAKKRLFSSYPGLGVEITTENRSSTKAAVLEFLRETRVQNADFLELAVNSYSKQVISDLAKERDS